MRLTSAKKGCGNTGRTVMWMLSESNPEIMFFACETLRSAERSVWEVGVGARSNPVVGWRGVEVNAAVIDQRLHEKIATP